SFELRGKSGYIDVVLQSNQGVKLVTSNPDDMFSVSTNRQRHAFRKPAEIWVPIRYYFAYNWGLRIKHMKKEFCPRITRINTDNGKTFLLL
ncbi:MAG: hypothetical protein K9K79_13345, partial [Desulfohalobiaceae bacterium]|nr:hypothetical protein [Desulfohalobiaceae bacterium]